MTITVRHLTRAEVAQVSRIDRSEIIHHIYVMTAGQLVRKPAYFAVKGWPPGEIEQSTQQLLDCYDRGGWCYGAFAEDQLVGVAILESKFIGPADDQLQLKFLHVSNGYRQHGLGRQLFELARTEARTRGARQMYVSATPSENTVHFYQRRGCVVAAPPDPELFALEPEDIHFVCPV
ncbi:MAG: GNAT family N-acetyltransferase [Caldilinea sp. CFX5]|nr:GNAT family N-acetyltransferase [Caldilinea sp. CFX5]